MKSALSRSLIPLAIVVSLNASANTFVPPEEVEIGSPFSKVLFKQVDANHDNKVSFDEVYQYRQDEEKKMAIASANEFFDRCDKNKDNKVGNDELIKFSMDTFMPAVTDKGCNAPIEMLDIIDTDMDGYISREEMMSTVNRYGKPPPKISKRLKEKEDKRIQKQQLERFNLCDKSKDQYLSFREAAAMNCGLYTEMFDLRDKNGDQLLSKDEMLAKVKEPVFPVEPMPIEMKQKMPPLETLMGTFFTCDKNMNGLLELSETVGKGCEVDIVFFNSVDKNADGAVDEIEMDIKRMQHSFDEMDTDKNGYLSPKEFKGNQIRYL